MKTFYAVMKLQSEIKQEIAPGQWEKSNILGCAGFIPVFETKEEAKVHADNGRFEILEISATEYIEQTKDETI